MNIKRLNDEVLSVARETAVVLRKERSEMTESEWLTSEDPRAMLRLVIGNDANVAEGLGGRIVASDRKLRLFACACVRQVWHLLTDDAECGRCRGEGWLLGGPGGQVVGLEPKKRCNGCNGTGRINRSRRAVEVAERYADLLANAEELATASNAARTAAWTAAASGSIAWTGANAAWAAAWTAGRNAGRHTGWISANDVIANLARCIFGNPFRPVTLSESCRTPTVVAIAKAAYDERPGRSCDQCVDGDVGCSVCEGAGIYYDPPYSLRRKKCPHCYDGLLAEKCKKCGGIGRIEDGTLDPVNLAVLADALEDAGCTNEGILRHLRSPGPHVRGCWALDFTLGRE